MPDTESVTVAAAHSNPSTVGIVGAGRMGRGIATAFALAGWMVRLIDLRPRETAALERLKREAEEEISESIAFLVDAKLLDAPASRRILERLAFTGEEHAGQALATCDVIFEAVPETLDAKSFALGFIGRAAPPDAIIASTTSTIDADVLGPMLRYDGRFLNAHWLNPAHLVPLVEVSPCSNTRPETLAKLDALLRDIGKIPVVCRSSPGYIVPRIQALAMNEAARIVEEGVASAEEVDTAIRVGFGFRFAVLGMLEFIDWGGGDILHHASRYLSGALDPVRFATPGIIEDNMAQDRNGLRDRKGFYDYERIDLSAYRSQRMTEFLALLNHRGLTPVIR